VGRAIKRQGTRDFWSLRLPEETRNYVPKFMAVLAISRDPSRYGSARWTSPSAAFDSDDAGPVDLRAGRRAERRRDPAEPAVPAPPPRPAAGDRACPTAGER
jgi:hypothetical protein